MNEKLKKVQELLTKYNQMHLLNFYEDMKEKKEALLDQILGIDFELVNRLYDLTKKPPEAGTGKLEPIPYIDKYKLSKEEYDHYKEKGIQKIKAGKLAVVTMAGGQGTRLGHNGPKGTFNLEFVSRKKSF